MRYIGIVIGSSVAIVVTGILVFKLGLLDTVYSHLGQLCLWSLIAIILSRSILTKGAGGSRSLLSFREMVITLGIVFVTICANVSSQALQMKTFGHTYTASSADPEPNDESDRVTTPLSVSEKITKLVLSVTAEEIPSRWITLGALLALMPAGSALLISSLLFALQHMVIPVLIGAPEIGFFRIAPTFMIGIGCGIAFMRSGLVGAILVHFLVNMVGLFAESYTYIADSVIFGSAFVALVVLPPTLWFTRKRQKFEREALVS
jgi:membrane protease YdiL (CAAX protease family)